MTISVAIVALVWLGCLFPALLIDAIKASPEEQNYPEIRAKACICFGAILLLLVLILN